jgi:phage-related protein
MDSLKCQTSTVSPAKPGDFSFLVKTVQFGWPLGMPLVDHLEGDIWEVRIKLDNRIARVLFVIDKHTMILLHGFIKKSQKTPKPEIDLAKQRLKALRGKQ